MGGKGFETLDDKNNSNDSVGLAWFWLADGFRGNTKTQMKNNNNKQKLIIK